MRPRCRDGRGGRCGDVRAISIATLYGMRISGLDRRERVHGEVVELNVVLFRRRIDVA
jgi:hypothetical protein